MMTNAAYDNNNHHLSVLFYLMFSTFQHLSFAVPKPITQLKTQPWLAADSSLTLPLAHLALKKSITWETLASFNFSTQPQ